MFMGAGCLTLVRASFSVTVFLLVCHASATDVTGWGEFVLSPMNSKGVRFTAVDGGFYHTVAVTTQGTVVAWGSKYYGEAIVPAGLSNVTAVAAQGSHTLALRRDGTVVAWGDN